jgi:hypothetical protein
MLFTQDVMRSQPFSNASTVPRRPFPPQPIAAGRRTSD